MISCHGDNGGTGIDEDIDSVPDSCGVNTIKLLGSVVVVPAKLYRLVGCCIVKEISSSDVVGVLKSCELRKA